MHEFFTQHLGVILPLIGVALSALLLPVGILITRDNVKTRRQEIIKDLEKFFRQEGDQGSSIIPSFEFVKSKYYVKDENKTDGAEIPIRWYSVPVIIFAGISATCFVTCSVLVTGPGTPALKEFVPRSLFLLGGVTLGSPSEVDTYFATALAIGMFAFLGAYVYAIKTFIRSVANFDLSPLTFFRASYSILASIIIAVALWRSVPALLSDPLQLVRSLQDSQALPHNGSSLFGSRLPFSLDSCLV